MRRIRTLTLSLLALTLTAFTLKEPTFEIAIPDGWAVGAKDAEGIITFTPPGADDGTNCNVYFVDRPTITGTQAALNKEHGAPLTVAGWHDFLATKPDTVKIEAIEAVESGGKILHLATVHITDKSAKARIGFIVTPGRVFDVGCYVRADRFESYAATFEKIVRALKPN